MAKKIVIPDFKWWVQWCLAVGVLICLGVGAVELIRSRTYKKPPGVWRGTTVTYKKTYELEHPTINRMHEDVDTLIILEHESRDTLSMILFYHTGGYPGGVPDSTISYRY